MSSATTVTITPDNIQAEPGSQVQVEISLRNTTNLVDVFTIDIEGLDESLFGLSTESVSLFPGDSASAAMTITIPRESAFQAKTYPFKVIVSCRKESSQRTEVSGSLNVSPFYSFNVEISPRRITGKSGDYTLNISNDGNSELIMELDAVLDEGDCSFSFSPERPMVPAGGNASATVTVTSNRRRLRGASETHRFTLKTSPDQGNLEPFSFPAELEVPPRLPKWAVVLAGVGAVAVVGAVVAVVAVIIANLGTDYDFEQDISRIRERTDEQVPSVRAFALNPRPDISVNNDVVVNATWASATNPSEAKLVIALQDPNGRCADVTEENEGAPAVIELVPDDAGDPAWRDNCPQMSANTDQLIANQWAVYVINQTNGQMSNVKLRMKYQ